MNALDLLVFDLDGTLVDSTGPQATAFAEVAITVGVHVRFDDAMRVYHSTAGMPLRQQYAEIVGDGADSLDHLESQFWMHLDQMTFHAFDDAHTCVDEIVSAGVAVGISSGSSNRSVAKKLVDSRLDRWFPIALGSDDEAIGSKGVQHLERIVHHHFGPNTRRDTLRIAFVGDTSHDLRLALDLGLEAYGVRRDTRLLPEQLPGSVVLDDLAELPVHVLG